MVQLEGLTNIEVNDITIENAPNEHLVAECDNNVTINDVTIQDPLKTQANTDGIDFSGTNFLIENCNISDGDDDICAKPDTTVVNGMTAYTANVNIENITITAGHGISIGGQTNAGLNGMYVNNVTETGANTGSSGRISNGIHLKAGDGNTTNNENGGLVQNVTFNNFTMTNVDDVLVINSYYNNGSDNYPSIPAPAYTPTPTEPIWKNITMENINCTNSLGSAAQIYGLNTATPDISGLNFENITFGSTESPWKMYYANDIYMDNVDVAGAELENNETGVKSGGNTENDEADDTNFVTPPNNAPIYTPPLAVVPEPMSLGLMLGAATILGASAAQTPRDISCAARTAPRRTPHNFPLPMYPWGEDQGEGHFARSPATARDTPISSPSPQMASAVSERIKLRNNSSANIPAKPVQLVAPDLFLLIRRHQCPSLASARPEGSAFSCGSCRQPATSN